MILQHNDGLSKDIQDIGCFYLSCLFIGSDIEKKDFSILEINSLWNVSKINNYINKDNNVTVSDKIINLGLKYLGSNKRLQEVAIFQNGRTSFYNGCMGKKIDYCIQKVKTGGKVGTHFRVVDPRGNILYDSSPNGYECKKILYSICYSMYEV